MEKKYAIELTERQMLLLERATVHLARTKAGQIDVTLMDECRWNRKIDKPTAMRLINELKSILWGLEPPYTSLSLSDDAMVLFEMYEVFRHQRYLDMPKEEQEKLEGCLMAYPAMQLSSEPLIKVKNINTI